MEKLILTLLILVSLILFLQPIAKVVLLMRGANGGLDLHRFPKRIKRFVSEVLFQSKVIGERPLPGLMHALVFWGFLAFSFETLDHFAKGYGFTVLGQGTFHDVFSVFVAFFAMLVIVGMGGLAFRRFVIKPRTLGKFSPGSFLVTIFIQVLMFTYLFEFFGLVEEPGMAWKINWWVHAVTILAFLILIPRSKHLHLVLSPFTTFLKDFQLAPLRKLDFENEEFGAERLLDLTPHAVLGAYSCVECGRCADHCPATQTDKTLNPKSFILNMRRGLNASPEEPAVGGSINETALWQCTTCGACSNQCPVGIEHVSSIISLRRGKVAEGQFPQPLMNLFKGYESSGNPWSYQVTEAESFLDENKVPSFEGQEVLYWMGCMGRYDQSYRKTSKAFMNLLNKSGSNWGVLRNEQCTGDAARRAGNEYLFQTLAEQNIEMLNEAAPKKIVATCPHCVWSLQEYRDFGLKKDIEIVHHAEFLDEAIQAGKLESKSNGKDPLVYHDACYLSRYRDEGVEKPRSVISASGHSLREVERSKTNSFCCGAGGAQLFNEETEGKRVNLERTEELLAANTSKIATSCPFCKLMVSDGISTKEKDVPVLDIAEVLDA